MTKRSRWTLVACAVVMLAAPVAADDEVRLTARLVGTNEVPPINSSGQGRFRATLHSDGSIEFQLSFWNLVAPATVSHIHFGQKNVAGGVMVFLCGGGGQPDCPADTSGTITGTITADNVVGPTAQGVRPGDLASALRIIIEQQEGYVNIHSTMFPGGEIRGQVRATVISQ